MFGRILIGVDFSECGERALDVARRQFPAAQRRLVHVSALQPVLPSPLDLLDSERESRSQAEADRSRLELLKEETESAVTTFGPAAEGLLDEAQAWGADLIVLGTHGRRGLDHLVFGSVAEQVVRTAGIPVLTVGRLTARVREPEPAPASVTMTPATGAS